MLPIAHFAANAINPLFIALLLFAPFLNGRTDRRRQFWIRSLLGIGMAVALAELGKADVVWPGHPTFPSGHETFALASATCLAVWDRRWLWVGLPLVLIIGWALVVSGFHHRADVFGALITGPLPAWGIQRMALGKRVTSPP